MKRNKDYLTREDYGKEFWDKLKEEYITSEISIRGLGRKYDVSYNCVRIEASQEGWAELREEYKKNCNQKAIEALVDYRAAKEEDALSIVSCLIDKVAQAVALVQPQDVGALKQLTSTLKDLKDIGVFTVSTEDDKIVSVIMEDMDDYTV